jgi:hypothetical protein
MMIAEQPAASRGLLARVLAALANGIADFVKTPTLPYAALAEAETLLRLISASGEDEYNPDPMSTEMPFLTGRWPHD